MWAEHSGVEFPRCVESTAFHPFLLIQLSHFALNAFSLLPVSSCFALGFIIPSDLSPFTFFASSSFTPPLPAFALTARLSWCVEIFERSTLCMLSGLWYPSGRSFSLIENCADKRALIEYTKEFVLTYSSTPTELFSASFNVRVWLRTLKDIWPKRTKLEQVAKGCGKTGCQSLVL